MAPGEAGSAVAASAAEKFSRGEPIAVEIDHIERALTDLWKAASQGGEGAVSRAALWNVVVPTRAQDLPRTKTLVDELAPLVPARVLVLVEEPETAEASAQAPTDDGVRATIESNVVARPSGTRVVYSEEITLRGRRGDARFGALVRALQIPGLPTATLWADAQMPEALLRRQLMPATDRLILDTGGCARPRQLLEVQRCADLAAGAQPVADLGWLRLTSFRLLFAGLFDAPVGGAPLRRARRVTILHRPGAEASALLLAAWVATTLGWLFTDGDPSPAGGGGLRFRFDRAEKVPEAPVEVLVRESSGACGTSGIVALELEAATPAGSVDVFAVRRTENTHATLELPIAPPRVVKLDVRKDAELTVVALGPAGRDPLFARCLSLAARLATVGSST